MNYKLADILDIPTLQGLLNSLDEINRMPSAILDSEGTILTATAWQDICTKFHRINPETAKKCTESDTHIKASADEKGAIFTYLCPMGLIDAAIPIVVDGIHLGNAFVGQLFLEPPDEGHFIKQARQYNFDEKSYVEAMNKVPVFSEEQMNTALKFIGNLVQLMAEQGLHGKRQLEAELELKEKEKKLKVIFDTSEAGIVVVSPLGIITFANRRMAEMVGMSLQDFVGTHYADHLHESEKQAGLASMNQITTGKVTSVELIRRYVRKDGTDFFGNITGTRLEDSEGNMRDQIIVISDITERMLAEEEKKLLEQQLQQAQKMESLGVLAGGVAHDFNNILTIIMGNCYLAKIEPEESEKYLSTIETAVERAAGLCRQMMAYAGKAPFDQTEFNLVLLVEEMVEMLKSTIPKNARIKFSSSADKLTILGDANQISQIVMNLVINASEAIGESQGEISISLSTKIIKARQQEIDYQGKTMQPGCYVCLSVADNGCGMGAENIRRIFEPFYTTKFLGRGLGMSATLGIITTHKGALQLYSQIGQGSTFKIFLPALDVETVEDADNAQTASLLPPLKSETVLLVEDEELVRLVAKTMIKKLGFTVLEASNGKEALEVYLDNASDIRAVITDIGMPIMDGYELFQRLKALNPQLPIIISSGFGDKVVSSRIPLKDIAGLVNKPYRFEQFQDIMSSVIGDVV